MRRKSNRPRRAIRPRRALSEQGWTAQDVAQILANPVYAGLGPYPPIVSDDDWVNAQVMRVQEQGAGESLALIRSVVLSTPLIEPGNLASPGWVEDSLLAIARDGAESFFHKLLADLKAHQNQRGES